MDGKEDEKENMDGEEEECYSQFEHLEIRTRIRLILLDPLKHSKMNGSPQMLQVNRMLNRGFRLQADLSQKDATVMARFPQAGPHFHHSSTSASWQADRRLLSAAVTSYPPAPDDATRDGKQLQKMSALTGKAPVQCDILIVFSSSHFFPISHFCFIPFFLFVFVA